MDRRTDDRVGGPERSLRLSESATAASIYVRVADPGRMNRRQSASVMRSVSASIEMRKVASFQHENVLYLEAGKRADTDVTRDIKARHSKIWRAVTPSALNAAFNRFSGNDDFDARTTAQFTKINAKRQATPKA